MGNALDQILGMFETYDSVMNPSEPGRRSHYNNQLNEFATEVSNSYENSNLNASTDYWGNWYEDNKEKFQPIETERYEDILRKAERRRGETNEFEASFKLTDGLMNQAAEKMELYFGANDATEFDISGSVVDADGVTQRGVIEELRMPLEDDFNNEDEYIAAHNLYADNLNDSRARYKQSLLDDVKSYVGSHTSQREQLINKYSDTHLTHITRSGASGYDRLQDSSSILSYGWQSIADDGVLDTEEYQHYMDAIQSGTSEYITNYLAKDAEAKTSHRNQSAQDLNTLYNEGEQNQIDSEKFNIAGMGTQYPDWENIKNQSAFKIGDKEYTFEDANISIHSGGSELLSDPLLQHYEANQSYDYSSQLEKIQNKNKFYMNNEGVDWLSSKAGTSGNKAWNDEINSIVGGTFAPGQQIDKKPTSQETKQIEILANKADAEVEYLKDNPWTENYLDVDSEISNIRADKPEWKTKGKSLVNKINTEEKESYYVQEELNQAMENYENMQSLTDEINKLKKDGDTIVWPGLQQELDKLKINKDMGSYASSLIKDQLKASKSVTLRGPFSPKISYKMYIAGLKGKIKSNNSNVDKFKKQLVHIQSN